MDCSGSGCKGVIGFAVGRTVFEEPIQKFNKSIFSKDQAISEISKIIYIFTSIH